MNSISVGRINSLFEKGIPAVAKCKHCMYELDWRLVDADLNRFGTSPLSLSPFP